jgi:pyridoxamine 5'-phosphate oxidase
MLPQPTMNPTDPIEHFIELLNQVTASGIVEPNAMALATADAEGRPSVRMVLLKEVTAEGFVFYTNLESRKAEQLHVNPYAALCFHWQSIGTQVRVEGRITPVTTAEADAYFASRSRMSQIGAWASRQSRQLNDRRELLERVEETESRFRGMDVPRPPFWSGFRIDPYRIEFWTAGEFRLHTRVLYTRNDNGQWTSVGLFP